MERSRNYTHQEPGQTSSEARRPFRGINRLDLAGGSVRVGLIGCGQIADAHLQEISRIRGAHLVGVCDLIPELAEQAAMRFSVPEKFTDIASMLAAVSPDIVHITTPAPSHARLAIQCLEAGCHVYLEKPFSLDLKECEQILAASNATGKLVCIGHDQLFDPLWLSLRDRVNSGEIGEVRHIESVLGYPISGNFGRQVVNNENHWVRQLPGGLFQNTISHPLYRITDFMLDETPQIRSHWRASDGRDFPTELDVSFVGKSVTGQLHFATNIPAQRLTRVYGDRGTLVYDPDNLVIRNLQTASLPGAFAKIEIPWKQFRESTGNLITNLTRFSRSEIHYFSGMRVLFAEFYRATQSGHELPIPYSEIRRTVSILDEIFDQCRANEPIEVIKQ